MSRLKKKIIYHEGDSVATGHKVFPAPAFNFDMLWINDRTTLEEMEIEYKCGKLDSGGFTRDATEEETKLYRKYERLNKI